MAPALYFVADVHLSPFSKPQDVAHHPFAIFLKTLPQRPHPIEGLYILGDLFDIWWGDDHNCAVYQEWEKLFSQLPYKVYFLSGNRDFLCSQDFAQRAQIELIKSGHVFKWGQYSIGLLHGDEPGGLKDWGYQSLRFFLRQPWAIKIFATLPERWRKACWLRGQSYRKKQKSKNIKVDSSGWIKQYFSKNPIDHLIHGHLHYREVSKEPGGLWRYQLPCSSEEIEFLVFEENGKKSFKKIKTSTSSKRTDL